MILSWLGLAALFTFALCRAASGPVPKPGFPMKLRPPVIPLTRHRNLK